MVKVLGPRTSCPRFARVSRAATLFCAERLRAPAGVVRDALRARGWSMAITTGDAAREALQAFRAPGVGLRVLCLPEPFDRRTREALARALDPLGRGDLLIVELTTPHAVVEAVQRFAGGRTAQRRDAPKRPSPRSTTVRAYLGHRMQAESKLELGYWSRYGAISAAAGLVLVAGVWAVNPEPVPHRRAGAADSVSPVAASPSRSPLVDRAALSNFAMTPIESDVSAPAPIAPASSSGDHHSEPARSEPAWGPPWPVPQRSRAGSAGRAGTGGRLGAAREPVRTRPIHAREHVPDPEPASLEPVELPAIPLEQLEARKALPPQEVVRALMPGGAPGLRTAANSRPIGSRPPPPLGSRAFRS